MNIKFLIGVMILVLATCSLYSPTPRGSGIEGQVLLGPMCPVVQPGQGCPDEPYQATLTVLTPEGLQVTQFETDAQGRFSVPLVPGEYILRPESPGGLPFAGDQPFLVQTGQYTQIRVHYDSGIR